MNNILVLECFTLFVIMFAIVCNNKVFECNRKLLRLQLFPVPQPFQPV
jgi:hypothetical protein